MRIPPHYKKPVWQRFFAGAAVGGCISWVVFLFMFGTMQERSSVIIDEQALKIKKLQSEVKIWQDDFQKLNKQNSEKLTIQEINVKLTHYEKYNIKDQQSIFNIQESIKEDLQSLLAKDVGTVYENKEIIMKTIENKRMDINGKRYQFIVREIYFYTMIDIVLEIKLAG